MTQIAELFVSLGIKGTEKTVGALSNVNKGLGEIASTSLAVKAAVIGAIYGLERLMSHSAAQGNTLSNFNAITGSSTKQLQQWQYAAQQAGASAEEFGASFKAVRDNITNIKLNEGTPKYIGVLASAVGFDMKKAKDAQTGAYYVLGQLQKLAKTNMDKDIIERVMNSFGVTSDTVKAGLFKGVFNEKNFQKAPSYGTDEINQLNKLNIAIKNLKQELEMAFGHFFSRHGQEFVDGLQKIITPVLKMVEAFTRLAEKLEVFKLMGEAFNGWSIALNGAANAFERLNPKVDAKQKAKDEEALNSFSNTIDKLSVGDQLQLFFKGLFGVKEDAEFFKQRGIQPLQNGIAPKVPLTLPQSQDKTQNIDINQNLYFQHEGKDHNQIKESTSQSVNNAWKQLWAQGRVT